MNIKKIGLMGGRGYVGQEILLLLKHHKHIEVTSIYSTSKAGEPLDPGLENSFEIAIVARLQEVINICK